MARTSIGIEGELYAYLLAHGVREHPLLRRLREQTAQLSRANMQISPEQGALMAILAQLIDARRCLEVGVFTGYSSLAVALVLPADGRLVACDINTEWTNIAKRYWREAGVDNKIELFLAPASETIAALLAKGEAGTYDFVFIDADKESYEDYFAGCLELLRPGGVILMDNVLWGGKVTDPNEIHESTKALRAFNERRVTDQRVDLVMIPVADGLTLMRKRP